MDELEFCPVCHEDSAIIEEEGGWCVYVQCTVCGTHTSFIRYDSEEEKADAEKKCIHLWNMGKVIREQRAE
ncbi:MAG: Lar family restriction alleviation protein [Lachnospiraceae bacterium]|nr:Lar family restriction alleviation protein [Lachnospiraceae bacterium]